MLLGFFIAYQAYLGSKWNDSPAMFYLAIGFTLVSIGPAIEGILFEVVELDIFLTGSIQTAIAAGMLLILYSWDGNHGVGMED